MNRSLYPPILWRLFTSSASSQLKETTFSRSTIFLRLFVMHLNPEKLRNGLLWRVVSYRNTAFSHE